MPTTTSRPGGRRQPAPRKLAPNRTAAPSNRSQPRRSFLWRWRRGLFLAGVLLIAALAGFVYALSQIDLPPERIQAQTSFICAADVTSDCNADNAMASLHGDQDRVNVTLAEVPPVFVNAVIAAEDRDFFK